MFFNLKSYPVTNASLPVNDAAEEQVINLETVTLLLNSAQKRPAEMWEDLVRMRKLDYSVLVRNLWNILVAAPHLIDEVVDTLTDERLIKHSSVLPVEFIEVVAAFEKDPPYGALRALAAISEAIDLSLANASRFRERTLQRWDSE